jgi:hypothetical protein
MCPESPIERRFNVATKNDTWTQAVEAIRRLTPVEKHQLIAQLEKELQATELRDEKIIPLALVGRWKGIDLSEEDIDEARKECWKGLAT